MPKVALLNVEGNQVGEIELNDAVFGIEPNESVVQIGRASCRERV